MFLKNMIVIGGERFWATICSPDLADFSDFLAGLATNFPS